MLLLTKSKGHNSNVHYSGFPNHLQTKSDLHISILQSKLKHKFLPLDTLYKKMIFTNKNVLITDNEIVDFAKFVEVVAIREINFKSPLLSSYQ